MPQNKTNNQTKLAGNYLNPAFNLLIGEGGRWTHSVPLNLTHHFVASIAETGSLVSVLLAPD